MSHRGKFLSGPPLPSPCLAGGGGGCSKGMPYFLSTPQLYKLDNIPPAKASHRDTPTVRPEQTRAPALQLGEKTSILNVQVCPWPHAGKERSHHPTLHLSQEARRFISFNHTFEQDTPRLRTQQKLPMGYPVPLRLQRLAATCLSALTSNALPEQHPREGTVFSNAGSGGKQLIWGGSSQSVGFATRPPGVLG